MTFTFGGKELPVTLIGRDIAFTDAKDAESFANGIAERVEQMLMLNFLPQLPPMAFFLTDHSVITISGLDGKKGDMSKLILDAANEFGAEAIGFVCHGSISEGDTKVEVIMTVVTWGEDTVSRVTVVTRDEMDKVTGVMRNDSIAAPESFMDMFAFNRKDEPKAVEPKVEGGSL